MNYTYKYLIKICYLGIKKCELEMNKVLLF